jgi:hypothetical protein
MHSKGVSVAGHEAVGKAISFHLQMAGATVYPEAAHLDENRRTRPDFVVISKDNAGNDVRLLTDHTIINTMAQSRAAFPVDTVLHRVESEKNKKYKQSAANMNATFVPMTFAAHGYISPKALALLRLETLAGCAFNIGLYGGSVRLINDTVAAVSCAVQKRNAWIVERSITMMQKKLASLVADNLRPPDPLAGF